MAIACKLKVQASYRQKGKIPQTKVFQQKHNTGRRCGKGTNSKRQTNISYVVGYNQVNKGDPKYNQSKTTNKELCKLKI